MSLQNLKDKLLVWLQSATVWFNAVMLAAFPFTDQIIQGINENLPALAPYLPVNVYKWVGLGVVIYNIVHGARRASQKAKEGI